MQFVRPSKISEKLIWLQFSIVLGFVLIAVAYFGQIYFTNKVLEKIDRASQFELVLERADIWINKAREKEIDFFATMDERFVKRHAKDMSQAYTTLDAAMKLSPNDMTSSQVRSIKQLAEEYEQAFQKAGLYRVELGLDETAGVQGLMREAVHNIEQVLFEVDSSKLHVSMLTLRRHEKDFILRNKDKYVKRMEKEVENFRKLVEFSRLSGIDKKNLTGKYFTLYRRI